MAETPWTLAQAADEYGIDRWGKDLFCISPQGHLVLTPRDGTRIDLAKLAADVMERGLAPPFLVRFFDVVAHRQKQLADVFASAFEAYNFKGRYRPVYPLKVNQHRHLVEDILTTGRQYSVGLEVGSAPELMAALVMLDDPEALLVVNGSKDARIIELALLGADMGRRVVVVLESDRDVEILLGVVKSPARCPIVGLRARLSSPGEGHWAHSVGDEAKFGLSAVGLVGAVERLREAGLLSRLEMFHFHAGSQMASIHPIKRALREARRIYVELARAGAPMGLFDVGGGLAVDYDGSATAGSSSMNYSAAEYARDVVDAIGSACDEACLPHPDIITECGRAMVAHTALLVTNVLGVEQRRVVPKSGLAPEPSRSPLAESMSLCVAMANGPLYREALHDALELREQCRSAFELGVVGLTERAQVEGLYWQVANAVYDKAESRGERTAETVALESALADRYFINLSIFRSLPDTWAIEQVFPIVPLHRLDERPTRRAILADTTCDSDGRIDRFVGPGHIAKTLALHTPTETPYLLGIPLVGAYQEILGDLHNLFGDIHAIHVRSTDDGKVEIDRVVDGDAIADVLSYVQYERKDLLHRTRNAIERRIASEAIAPDVAMLAVRRFITALDDYTYLYPIQASGDWPGPELQSGIVRRVAPLSTSDRKAHGR